VKPLAWEAPQDAAAPFERAQAHYLLLAKIGLADVKSDRPVREEAACKHCPQENVEDRS